MGSAVAFVLGEGNWAGKGLALARSVALFSSGHEVFVAVPSAERDGVPASVLEECRSLATVVEVDPPIDGYPIATKILALKRAVERFETGRYVLLDTDTLVLADLDALPRAELGVRPANFARRWRETGMGELLDPSLYEAYGFTPPEGTVTGTVDGRKMLPCWNAGVVTTTDPDFPGRWLDLTRELIGDLRNGRFADQVALSLLSTEVETTALSTLDNFPGAYRLRFPTAIRILHYHNFRHVARIRNPHLRRKFRRIGVGEIVDRFVDEPIRSAAIKHTATNLLHRIVGW
jgi:hypothetical protein